MKNFQILIVLLLPLSVLGQTGIIKFQPLPLASSVPTISLGYEHVISEKGTLQLNIDYASESFMGFKSTWTGLGVEYRIYNLIPSLNTDNGGAPSGLFIAPTVGIRFFKDVDTEDKDPEFEEKYSFGNAGALIGYQWIPTLKNGKKLIALEASVGLLGGFMLKGDSFDYEDYAVWPRFNIGFIPTANIGIGVAFGK